MRRLGAVAFVLPVVLVLVVSLGSCSLVFNYSSIKPKHYAIVYGVSMYDPGPGPGTYPNLRYPGADALSLAQVLAAKGYDEVRVRAVDYNGDVHLFDAATESDTTVATVATDASEAPTKDRLASDITYFSSKVGPDDVLLIYFSGHGMADTLTPPSYHDYFIPYGGVSGGYGDLAKSVRDDELAAMLSPIQTKKRIVILDTCNSGGFIGNVLEVDTVPPISTDPAPNLGQILSQAWQNYRNFPAYSPTGVSPFDAMVLSAAGKDELSWEDGAPFDHGIMTFYLLQGLSGTPPADLNKDGTVTVTELFSYTKAGVDVGWNALPFGDPSSYYYGAAPFEPHVSGGPVDFALY